MRVHLYIVRNNGKSESERENESALKIGREKEAENIRICMHPIFSRTLLIN
jgi:hypothetical protein